MGRMRPPFRGLTTEQWQNLAIAALLVFYAAQIALDIAWGNLFGHFASDFASFWSAGFIANHQGYAAVYNLDLIARIQHPLLPTISSASYVFHPIPTPYLPVFILPFQLLALAPPVPAAYVWVIVNFLGTVAYLWFFSNKISGRSTRGRLIILMMVSAPVFLNLIHRPGESAAGNMRRRVSALGHRGTAISVRPLARWPVAKAPVPHSDRAGAPAPAVLQDCCRLVRLQRRILRCVILAGWG